LELVCIDSAKYLKTLLKNIENIFTMRICSSNQSIPTAFFIERATGATLPSHNNLSFGCAQAVSDKITFGHVISNNQWYC
jgi:hypothetical protein